MVQLAQPQQRPNGIYSLPLDAASGETSVNDVIRDDAKNEPPVILTAASITRNMEALEIEIGTTTTVAAASSAGSDHNGEELEGDFSGARTPETRSFDEDDDVFNDMENLLGNKKEKDGQSNNGTTGDATGSATNDSAHAAAGQQHVYCVPCFKIQPEMTMGNVQVPSLYVYGYTGGWGVIGPHWFGPPCVMALLVGATYYFAHQMSYQKGWYWTMAFCYYLAAQTFYFLLSAAYRDAGIVRDGRLNVPDPVPRTFRWCETCQYHQPPTTLHCPDCNACVLGFDHHCVWMGNCIGVANFKPFMRFNLSWLFYLVYAIIWVSIVAPILDRHHHQ